MANNATDAELGNQPNKVTGQPNGIGIMGGSFDPVHLGHLWMGEAAREQLPIEHVRWFPAATSPLKPDGPVATNTQRWQMLRLALSGQTGHEIDPWELERDAVSYTVDTLEYLKVTFPGRALYLIVGGDSLASFDRWKQPARILELCTLCVVARGGHATLDYDVLKPFTTTDKISECQTNEIRMPLIEISSRQIRDNVRAGKSIRFQVPHPVEAYIRQERLFA
ncbi:nicotinate (nicotinamide) nucleotide adenylyltransferase [Neorhodopirellula pilleata]|uniref:Probable nicotinate-nucleotide adenylyltransferase n=1 Tax=Neorhodopirellula pilleata TaxID=2714738 RepID=A0A5C6A8B8_9BACT|nr:nicotinate (nicotinamide) nucleotide adenylyltransferase [Neorhodopirellula pilleata]TWT95555.1 Nicotinate-nucleotide adenylyltransferase [Neorhodopirellula pilleata]